MCAEGFCTERIKDRAMKFKGLLAFPHQSYITEIPLVSVKLFMIYVYSIERRMRPVISSSAQRQRFP